jgi:hemoglobin
MLRPSPPRNPSVGIMSELYETLGGDTGLTTVVEVFYSRVTADPELAPYFAHVDLDRLRAHQRSFLRAALDGPEVFTGRPLASAHAGLHITDAHFDGIVDHLASTLGDLGIDAASVALVRERVDALRPQVVV